MMKKQFDFFIDRGGTFTDVFYRQYHDAEFHHEGILKILSEDPSNYDDAPREAIKRIVDDESQIRTIKMGTTVATNALLERKGAKTAFLTTKGFKDLLEIAFQNRPKIFDLNIKKAQQLYNTVIELEERIFPNCPQDNFCNQEAIKKQLIALKNLGIESLAIALLHSYNNDTHEQMVKKIAEDLGFQDISLSSELVPMIKFVPRASTTVIDAYLTPVIKNYIQSFKSGFKYKLENTKLLFMKSDGSLATENDFRGFNSILSGPAGGLTALKSLYEKQALIGFDMGGTSTDVSRYAGDFNLSFDSEIEGLLLQSSQLDINTIAAGGGSRLFYENGLFRVGPESAGSHPGPVCYKKDGYLSITDANLVLGRLHAKYFPKVFGVDANEALDYQLAYKAFEDLREKNNLQISVEEIAQGFIQVANETMARPIREVSLAKGFDIQDHKLVCFGGAASQHAVALARLLGIKKVLIHRFSGILSAFGISLAEQSWQKQKSLCVSIKQKDQIDLAIKDLETSLNRPEKTSLQVLLNLRYQGTDTQFLLDYNEDCEKVFKQTYLREFGFNLEREIICDDVLLIKTLKETQETIKQSQETQQKDLKPIDKTKIFFAGQWQEANVYNFADIKYHDLLKGPAMIMQDTTTIILEPHSQARLDSQGNLELEVFSSQEKRELENNPINLAIFSNRFMSIAEQMGKALERTSISTNIKERRDFSCALFDAQGNLIANAPHQPVHLGSMGFAVKKQIEFAQIKPGDVILSNHPIMGGSHLPDLTVISPVFNEQEQIIFFVANRAHHADVGGICPGSMPSFSKTLSEEGVAIKSFKLVEKNLFQEEKLKELFCQSRLLKDNISDLRAQVAANNQGIHLLQELIKEYSQDTVLDFMQYILKNSQNAVLDLLKATIVEPVSAEDFLDDKAKIALKISFDNEKQKAVFDFSESSCELDSNLNTPTAVVSSAVLYCLRAIINKDIPLNQGFLQPIEIKVAQNSILNPSEDKAVVAGNVQTSQRIVDVILKAFNICAASQGCMNNVIFGNSQFGYYETIGGGAGAGCIDGEAFHGASGVHTHMTNTRITDAEILETRYPVLLQEFAIRKNSGGHGKYNGGNGLLRHFKFLDELELSLLTERRVFSPYGLNGASPGKSGENLLFTKEKDGALKETKLASKVHVKVHNGDELKILTPGGGGFGN